MDGRPMNQQQMVRRWRRLAVLSLVATLVVACSGSGGGESPPKLTDEQRSELLQTCLASLGSVVRQRCASEVEGIAQFVSDHGCTFADAAAMMTDVAHQRTGIHCPSKGDGPYYQPGGR